MTLTTAYTADFSLKVQGVEGLCPAAEAWAHQHMIHIDALALYEKYTEIFLMDDVPEDKRKAVARQVADKIIARLKEEAALTA